MFICFLKSETRLSCPFWMDYQKTMLHLLLNMFHWSKYIASILVNPLFCNIKQHKAVGLARLIVISVNWSIHHRKTIIDEKKEIIDYLLLLFCIEIYEKLQLYFIFSIFKPSDLVNVPKEEVESFYRLV